MLSENVLCIFSPAVYVGTLNLNALIPGPCILTAIKVIHMYHVFVIDILFGNLTRNAQ